VVGMVDQRLMTLSRLVGPGAEPHPAMGGQRENLVSKLARLERLTAQLQARGSHSSTSQLNVSTLCGIRWVPSVYRWVTTGHKLDSKRLTAQNGLG